MDYINPSISDTLLISFVGFLTVFVVLLVLMVMIKLISLASNKNEQRSPNVDPPAPPAPVKERDEYTGVKLYDTPEKTAAVIMAIVADSLDVPPDNLRFISIKEVK